MSTDKTIKEAVNDSSDSALKRGGNEEKAPKATETVPNVQSEANHASQAAEDVRDASVAEPNT